MSLVTSSGGRGKSDPKVSVITLNWNNPSDTLECLQSLEDVEYSNFDTVVVDNGSTDDSSDLIAARFPRATLIRNEENLGYTGGNNVGIEHALRRGAEYVFILNNDAVVDRRILGELVSLGESDPSIGMIACKVYQYGKDRIIDSAGCVIDFRETVANNRGHDQKDAGQFDAVEEVDSADGCGFLVKREVIETIGLFDESFFAYCEEIDWNIRARKSGFKVVYCPGAVLWHKGSGSTGGRYNPFRSYLMGKSAVIFMRKHASIREWLTFGFHLAARFPVALVRHAVKGDAKAFFSKFKGGFRGLRKRN